MYSITEYGKKLALAINAIKSLDATYQAREEIITAEKILQLSLTLETTSNPLEVEAIDTEMTALDAGIGPLHSFYAEDYKLLDYNL